MDHPDPSSALPPDGAEDLEEDPSEGLPRVLPAGEGRDVPLAGAPYSQSETRGPLARGEEVSDSPRFRVPFRRRREGRTDYRYRRRLLLSGQPRAVVRVSHGRVRVSLTSYDPVGDRVIAAAESIE